MSSASNTLPMKLQDQEGEAVSWSDLPSDLYSQILRRLPCCADGVRLSAVCRHWRACAQQHFPRRRALPMRVTRTARGTHVVHVRGFSLLQEQHLPLCQPLPSPGRINEEAPEHQQCLAGFLDSPAFAAAGLDWAIRYYPGSDDDDGERGFVGFIVRLLTEDAVVSSAHVGLRILDQTTGVAHEVIWDDWMPPVLFDAVSADLLCARGSRRSVARSFLKGFVRGDRLKIECVIHVDQVFSREAV